MWSLTPAAWHMVLHLWSHWVPAIINGWVLCLYAFKMHFFAYGWCLHTFFFRDKREDSATPSESLWTFQIQHSRVVFTNTIYFVIFHQHAVTKKLNQVYKRYSLARWGNWSVMTFQGHAGRPGPDQWRQHVGSGGQIPSRAAAGKVWINFHWTRNRQRLGCN